MHAWTGRRDEGMEEGWMGEERKERWMDGGWVDGRGGWEREGRRDEWMGVGGGRDEGS